MVRGHHMRPVCALLAVFATATVAAAEDGPQALLAGPVVARPADLHQAGEGGRGTEAVAAALDFLGRADFGGPEGLRAVTGPRRFVQPLSTAGGPFFLVTFEQVVGGLPVVDAEVRVLVRKLHGAPSVVLARSTLRPVKNPGLVPPSWTEAELRQWAAAALGREPSSIEMARACAWVGPAGEAAAAVRCVARAGEPGTPGYTRRLLVLDATPIGAVEDGEREKAGPTGRGRVLLQRDLVVRDATVRLGGLASAGCLPPGLVPGLPGLEERALPHARVTSTATGPLYADALGNVTVPGPLGAVTLFSSSLRGRWFRVVSAESPDLLVTGPLEPGGELTLVHNLAGLPADTAQVNAYVAANEARDWALAWQPDFPGLDHFEMPVNVGLDSTCNAYYDGSSLNFFRAGGGCSNTAYCSIVHHEYAHHLVSMAGSGQGAYGEGFADVVAMLMRDDPGFAYGYHGDPSVPLRSGENTLMHPCAGDAHICGMVLSGAVWETRNRLAVTEPDEHRAILTQLMLASVFLHTGAEITPDIVVDLLTLDDDDDDIYNGTPHYAEISGGFAAHGLDAPALPPVGLRFPAGRPEVLPPRGGALVVQGVELGGTLESVTLYSEIGGATTSAPLSEIAANEFAATFPEMPCGAEARYYFELTTTDGSSVFNPVTAPALPYRAIVASAEPTRFVDDFELDKGWTVASGGGLTDGAWQRGAPAGIGDRGDPTSDADGSGQCWLTANRFGNSDVDNGWTSLTSPAVVVSSGSMRAGRVILRYSRWFYSQTTGAAPDDVFVVEASGDDGTSWTVVETVGPDGPGITGGWITREFVLSDAMSFPSGTLRVRFTASDTGVGSIVEAGVDAVQVAAYPCAAACACDLDGDAAADVDDLLAYLDGWFSAAPAADWSGDGGVDVVDLLLYLDCWFEGCGG